MLGNWSLGDYFKEESIQMSFEFPNKRITNSSRKIICNMFLQEMKIVQETQYAAECWKKAGILEDHIYYYGKDDNWWIAGEEGPCGPDTEMFYDTGKPDMLRTVVNQVVIVVNMLKYGIMFSWNILKIKMEIIQN